MSYCPEGTSQINSFNKEKFRQDKERLHEAAITKPCWLIACEIVQALKSKVMECNNTISKAAIITSRDKESAKRICRDGSVDTKRGFLPSCGTPEKLIQNVNHDPGFRLTLNTDDISLKSLDHL